MPARKKAAATASKASSSKATSSSSSKSDSKPVKRLSSKATKKDEKETAAAPDKQIVKVPTLHLKTNKFVQEFCFYVFMKTRELKREKKLGEKSYFLMDFDCKLR